MQLFVWIMITVLIPAVSRGQADFTRQLLSVEHYEIHVNTPAAVAKKLKRPRKPAAVTVDEKSSPEVQIEVPAPPPVAAEPLLAEPGLGEQAHSLLNDPSDKIGEFYRERVHPDDIRNNKVEIQIRPGFTYTDSRANYSYRNYQSAFNNVDVRSNVWFVPLIGLSGAIRFSLGASVRGDSSTGSMDLVHDESMELGLKFRHFFGLSRKSTAIEYSVFYVDHSFNVSKDSVSHPRTRTSGVGFGAQLQIPSSLEHAWVLGGKFAPRLQQQENPTAINVQSGSAAENILLGLELGGQWRLSREHQVQYGFEMTSERNLFSGAASNVDPQTGTTPSNVTVTDTRFNFFLGYRWGH